MTAHQKIKPKKIPINYKNYPFVGKVTAMLLTTIFLLSCQDDIVEKEEPPMVTGEMPDGSKNPFTLENTIKALENLQKSNPNGRTSTVPITATHDYIKFSPSSQEELIELQNLGYELFEAPLDEDVATYQAANPNAVIPNEFGHLVAMEKKTTSGSGRPAVVESWGFYVGPTFNRTKYSNIFAIRDREDRVLENQRRDDTVPYASTTSDSRGWIPAGFLHDCTDVGQPTTTGINDLASGYTMSMLFRGYSSSATTVQTLRANILSSNGNAQATQVNNLVTSYGW